MRFLGILRFEAGYQLRRPWPWLAFAVLVIFAFQNTRVGVIPVTLPQDFILNSPFIIATVSVFSCMIWLLVASPMAGEAAARDVQTRMHPLFYTSSVREGEYLGGRFAAAFALNALVLLGVQVGSLLGVYAGGVDPSIIGPFRPAAYLAAYAFIAVPNAFIATTVQFACALLSGRSMASYFGSILLVFFSAPVPLIVYFALGQPKLALMMDPIGMLAIMNEMMSKWTIVEKNVRMFTLDGPMLWNRVLWVSIALAIHVFLHVRFRFAHRTALTLEWIRFRRRAAAVPAAHRAIHAATPIPHATQSFGFATHLRQTIAIAWSSFRMIARSPAGLFLLLAFPMMLVMVVPLQSVHWGVQILPRTDYILTKHLTGAILSPNNYWMVVPLLIIYFAGELIWRERDAGMSESVDATSVPDWSLVLGKLAGLGFFLVVLMVMVTASGIVAQTIMGYHNFQLDVYVKILFGVQLPDYLLFAVLAFFVHAIVNQKQVGLIAALVVYACLIFARRLGVEHNLLIYGSGPQWLYSEMRGFGSSLAPWGWFKAYWAAWAFVLLAAVRLLWTRGREPGFTARLRMARGRLTRRTLAALGITSALVLLLGGFVYYNTNVLNDYSSAGEVVRRRAEYEHRYGRYERTPQPQRTAVNLRVDIHPERGTARVRGTYTLENRTDTPIDTLHLAPAAGVATRLTLDRGATLAREDTTLRHSIYVLAQPLQPGDTMTLGFDVEYAPRGFRNSGGNEAITRDATRFTGGLLPGIGYQAGRELTAADERRVHGLPRQVTFPAPDDVDPEMAAGSGVLFDAVVSTSSDQVAVAPGTLRRSWTEGGRRYFHYVSDTPIAGQVIFYSAAYTVHQERWNDVDLKVFLHPRHTRNLARVLRSTRASLDYYTTNFGPYPHAFLHVIEEPRNYFGMGVDGSGVVTGGEGFFLLNPKERGLDVVFEVVAHEMAHLWWGAQLTYAPAEGAILLSESLAWYSAMQVVDATRGREALRQFMHLMREPNPWPPIRTGLPLLRAMDPYAGYRKGPFAFYALSQYIGEDRVNLALRRLLEKKTKPAPSAATTTELYRELQAVTPASYQPLLRELFETDMYWKFDTKHATAVQTASGEWQVTLEVEALKAVADSAGKETILQMNDMVEIGLFAEAAPGEILGAPLYLEKHRIRSGTQTITVMLPQRPARGGIDPYNLLDWEEGDNIEPIEPGAGSGR